MRNKLILLLIIMAGLVLRLNGLGGRSLWTDEFFTFFQATGHGRIQGFLNTFSGRQYPEIFKAGDFKAFLKNDPQKGLRDVTEGLIKEDTHPPFYFLIMHIWMKLFGDGVFVVRLFSVLCGLLCIILAYKVALRLFDEKAAFFSAVFVSISPFAVRYSQEARAYSLITAIGLASWLVILRYVKHRKTLDLVLFAILNLLGIFTHYFYIFVSCAQFLYFTVSCRNTVRRRLYAAFLFSMLLFFASFMLFYFKTYNFYLAEWAFGHSGPISGKVFDLFVLVWRYFFLLDAPKVCYLFFSSLLFAYMFLHRKRLLFCIIMLLFPLLSMLFLDILQQGVLLKQERFSTFSFIGFIPLAGYILSNSISKRKIILYPVAIFMVLSSLTASGRQYGPAPKFISGWINKESAGKPSAVIVCNIRCVVAAQAYYLDDGFYLVAVENEGQLLNGVKALSNLTDKIFIVRHFHSLDPFLMDRVFMGTMDIDSGFRFSKALQKDDISVSEFVK